MTYKDVLMLFDRPNSRNHVLVFNIRFTDNENQIT